MFTVAIIGPDGAGKTTISRQLEHALPAPVKYLYMGVNLDSSNRMLPTTRLFRAVKRMCGAKPDTAGPRDPEAIRPAPAGMLRRLAAAVKSGLSLVNRVVEEWYRQCLAWHYQRRGYIVLFDRHYFIDYYAHDIAENNGKRPLGRRIHGFLLEHLYPKPQLVIYLDAPGEVLFARKGEGSIPLLERRRQDYLAMRGIFRHFVVVDASRPQDAVVREVRDHICAFHGAGNGSLCRRPSVRRAPKRPVVLVTDAGCSSALSIIRSLGRRGWRVIAADSDPCSSGFYSCYAAERLLYPPPKTSPRECVTAICKAVRERKIDLIIPVTDIAILPLSASRERFEGLCTLALPERDALEVVTDKARTLELARRLDVPVPRTVLVHSVQEALRHGPELGWPLVLKPAASKLYHDREAVESFSVCYAANPDDLARQIRPLEGRCPVLLQQYCGGAGRGVDLLTYRGRVVAAFQHRRLREVPVTGGRSALCRSVPLDPTLYNHAVRMLAALQWTGLAMVEFKGEGEHAMLMEINGRVWGSMPLAVDSGMDFPARLADLWLYGPPSPETPPDTSYRVGVCARNLELDFMWIASVLLGRRRYSLLPMPRRRQALTALAQLANPAYRSDFLSLEDPWPALAGCLHIVRKFAAKLAS